MDGRPTVTIYTDGSSRGNPGPGGYGAVLMFVDGTGRMHMRELSQGYRLTTNNRMELMGVIAALERLEKPCVVELYSDSAYVINPFVKHWIEDWQRRGWKKSSKEPVKNVDLWERLLAAMEGHEIHWHWLKGHNGTKYNERCDQLATGAADSDQLIEDNGYNG